MSDDPRPHLRAILSADAGDEAAWFALFEAEAGRGAVAEVLALLAQRHERRRDAARWAFSLIHHQAMLGRWDALRALHEGTPKDSPFAGFFAYGAALRAAREFDLDATADRLREAAHRALAARQAHFAHEPNDHLGEILPIGGMIEKADYAAGPPPPIDYHPPPLEGAGPLVFAACDDSYFQTYAERFLASLRAALPGARALIHIVNPDAAGEALRAGLARDHAVCAFTVEPGPRDTAFYAARRFMLAGAALRQSGRDIVVVDMDSVFSPAFAALVARAAAAPLAVIAPPTQVLPTLKVAGAFLYAKAGAPMAGRFLDRCHAYLARKFADGEAGWYLDQAALFRAVCLAGREGEPVLDLAEADPRALDALVGPHLVPEAIRMEWRSRHRAVSAVSFDSDLRPRFRYVAE